MKERQIIILKEDILSHRDQPVITQLKRLSILCQGSLDDQKTPELLDGYQHLEKLVSTELEKIKSIDCIITRRSIDLSNKIKGYLDTLILEELSQEEISKRLRLLLVVRYENRKKKSTNYEGMTFSIESLFMKLRKYSEILLFSIIEKSPLHFYEILSHLNNISNADPKDKEFLEGQIRKH